MVEQRSLHPNAEGIFEEVLKQVEAKFTVERKTDAFGARLLAMFSGLSHYERLYVHQVTEFTGAGSPFIVLLLEKHQTITKRLGSSLRYQTQVEEVEPVVIFSLAHNLGQVVIQKETLGDKIANLFTKQDINFEEYPQFSRNYTVAGDKPEAIKAHLPVGLLEALSTYKGLHVEINQKLGLLRTEMNLSAAVLLRLINIGNLLSG